MDNDNLVGRDCLTFLYKHGGITVRGKFYNKYVCQLRSPGVSYDIGC